MSSPAAPIFSNPNTTATLTQANKNSNISFLEGVIIEYNRISNQYSVNAEGEIYYCVAISSVLSSILGLRSNVIYEPKTKVLILSDANFYMNRSYIIGSIASGAAGDFQRAKTSGVENKNAYDDEYGKADIQKGQSLSFRGGQDISANVYPGEFSLQNAQGCSIELLQTLSRLSASQLASIECFLMDDMVRIISDAYEHITAFGNYKIFNEKGALNVVWEGTSNEFEAFGKETKSEDKGFDVSKNSCKTPEDEDAFKDNGRWRFASYIGKLGNFINMFITDPQENLDDAVNKGLCRIHVNEDGSILLQSVNDIIFEKVVAIPVPKAIKSWEEASEELDAITPLEPFDWDYTSSFYELSYKLRDYAKWFANYYSMAEFIRNKRFKVPSEEAAVSDSAGTEGGEKPTDYSGRYSTTELYSTIRIFRNGAIMLYDASGNCVHLNETGVQISSTGDINLSAAGNINLKAGKSVTSLAVKHTEFTSATGSLSLFADTIMQLYVDKGTLSLQSNASKDTLDSLSKNETEPRASTKEQPIAINIVASGVGSEDADKSPNIVIQSTQGNISLKAESGIITSLAKSIFNKMQQLYTIGESFIASIAGVHVLTTLYSKLQTVSRSFSVSKLQVLEKPTMLSPEPRKEVSLIPVKKEDKVEKSFNELLSDSGADKDYDTCVEMAQDAIDEFKFREDYAGDITNPSAVYLENMSEQCMRLFPSNSVNGNNYSQMDIGNKLVSDKVSGKPFPGSDTPMMQYTPKNKNKPLGEALPNQPSGYAALRKSNKLKEKKDSLKIWTATED